MAIYQPSTYQPSYFFENTTQQSFKLETDIKPLIQEPNLKNNQGIYEIWFEKYRPKAFNEIVGQDQIINSIMAKLNNLPHMILEGKAGTGKTSIIRLIAKQLNADVLELNSSDERGINTIRKDKKIPNSGRVSDFIRNASIQGTLKIVFFDEADGMTSEAQDCLKAMIEKYSSRVRFIFACNDIKKIIEPIKSRCKAYHFEPCSIDSIVKRLKQIAAFEHLNIPESTLNKIADDSQGDMRKAINDLQAWG